jgi:hypothetical protein
MRIWRDHAVRRICRDMPFRCGPDVVERRLRGRTLRGAAETQGCLAAASPYRGSSLRESFGSRLLQEKITRPMPTALDNAQRSPRELESLRVLP